MRFIVQDTDLLLSKVHMRLGDLYCEDDKFTEALDEFTEALVLRSRHLERSDKYARFSMLTYTHPPSKLQAVYVLCSCRRLADVMFMLSTTYIQLASEKEVEEQKRKTLLSKALLQAQAAAECLSLAAAEAGAKLAEGSTTAASSAAAFLKDLQAEVAAGALRHEYPAGRTESVAHPTPLDASKGIAEPEIVVFQSNFKKHLQHLLDLEDTSSSVAAPDAATLASLNQLKHLSEFTDVMLQRVCSPLSRVFD
jgi:ribonuclease D